MNSAPISSQLREDFDLVGHIAVRARVFLDIWWIYDGKPSREKHLETMNRFSEFYRFEPHAHFVAMVMYLSQLFESRDKTLNLPSLLENARSIGILKSAGDQGFLILDSVKPLISKVTILRSNLFAHRNAKLSYEEVFDKAKVTPDQLRELSKAALRIANLLGNAADIKEKFFHTLAPFHAEAVLIALAGTYAES